jgi:hypothetical protein
MVAKEFYSAAKHIPASSTRKRRPGYGTVKNFMQRVPLNRRGKAVYSEHC